MINPNENISTFHYSDSLLLKDSFPIVSYEKFDIIILIVHIIFICNQYREYKFYLSSKISQLISEKQNIYNLFLKFQN